MSGVGSSGLISGSLLTSCFGGGGGACTGPAPAGAGGMFANQFKMLPRCAFSGLPCPHHTGISFRK